MDLTPGKCIEKAQAIEQALGRPLTLWEAVGALFLARNRHLRDVQRRGRVCPQKLLNYVLDLMTAVNEPHSLLPDR